MDNTHGFAWDYVAALGNRRLAELETDGRHDSLSPAEVVARSGKPTPTGTITAAEWMTTMAVREVVDRGEQASYDVLFVRPGLAEVAGSVARELLREVGVQVSLVGGQGVDFGCPPQRSHPCASTAVLSADPFEVHGVTLGGTSGSALAILGAVQVDGYGRLNSGLVGGTLLEGSGGANDAAVACDAVVVTRHSPRHLVKSVEYVTCPGYRVRAVVTERAVFRKDNASGTLVLTSFVGDDDIPDGWAIDWLSPDCGWDINVDPQVQRAALPGSRELAVIRRLMWDTYR